MRVKDFNGKSKFGIGVASDCCFIDASCDTKYASHFVYFNLSDNTFNNPA